MLMTSHTRIKVPHLRWHALLTALLFDLSLIAELKKLLDNNGNPSRINCYISYLSY